MSVYMLVGKRWQYNFLTNIIIKLYYAGVIILCFKPITLKDKEFFLRKKIKMFKKTNKSIRIAANLGVQLFLLHLSNVLVLPGNMLRSSDDH